MSYIVFLLYFPKVENLLTFLGEIKYMWQQWVNGILGIVIAIASWSYMAAGSGRTSLIVIGIVVAILGFWGAAMSSSDTNTYGRTRQGGAM